MPTIYTCDVDHYKLRHESLLGTPIIGLGTTEAIYHTTSWPKQFVTAQCMSQVPSHFTIDNVHKYCLLKFIEIKLKRIDHFLRLAPREVENFDFKFLVKCRKLSISLR